MAPIGSKTISLKIPVNWLWGIVTLAIVLIVAFVLVPAAVRPMLVFGAAVLAGAATLTTAVNNVDQRAAQAEKASEAAKDVRVAAALEFFYRWIHPHFYHCKKNGREILKYFKDNPSIDVQTQYLKEDPSKYGNLIDVLNTFEALAIAIDMKAVDDETAKRFFRSIVLEYWHLSEGVLKKSRAEHNNARLYKEFESLYDRWKS